MKTLAGIRVLSTRISPLWKRLTPIVEKTGRLLLLSLGEEAVMPKRVICASIEKNGFSVVYGRRLLSRVFLKAAQSFPYQGYPAPADLASGIELAAKEMGVAGVPVSIAVPKAWTVIKTFTLPRAVKANLSDVLSYEMDRVTPFSSDEALYDFEILKETDEFLHIAVVATRAEKVMPYAEALLDRGLQVEKLTSAVSGTGALFLKRGWKDCIFLELSDNEYHGAVYEGGLISASFSQSLPGGEESGRELGESAVAELEKQCRELGKEMNILVSVRDQASLIAGPLKGLRGVTFITAADSGFGASSGDASLSSLGCLVESLWHKAPGLNLLTKGRREKSRPAFFLTGLLALGAIAMAVAYTVMPLKIEEQRLDALSRQIAMRKEGVQKVEALRSEREMLEKEIATVNGFKGEGPLNLDILKELTAIIPKDTWLTRVQINGSFVQIEGFAKTATELLPRIESSKYFKKAEFALSTVRDQSMKAERFAIKMEVEGPATDEKK